MEMQALLAMATLIVELLFIVLFTTLSLRSVSAQQAYAGNELFDCRDNSAKSSGYVCNGAEKSCDAYSLFHARPLYRSLFSISKLFNVGISKLMSANNLSSTDTILKRHRGVVIPLRCRCMGTQYQSSPRYNVLKGDSYFSLTKTLEGLTSCEALQKQNPGIGLPSLRVGENIVIPLRCACPTAKQIRQGIKYLMTYALKNGDTMDTIADTFNTSEQDIAFANKLHDTPNSSFFSGSLLVPLMNKPVIHHTLQVPAAATGPQSHHGGHVIKSRRKKKKTKVALYIGIVAGTLAVISATGAVWLVTRRRTKSLKEPAKTIQYQSPVLPTSEARSVSGKYVSRDRRSDLTDLLMLTYTLDQLKKATENFSPDCRIEGSVYHGILSGIPLAIKQTKARTCDDLRALCEVQHSNLIKLLGICNEGGSHSYLVFEFAENGSLSDWLHGGLVMKNKFITSCSRFLTWDQRLHICLDVAMGLQYIHEYRQPSYLHRDITSSNILLNAELKAKIANFNMGTQQNISGTPGYIAPEYLSQGLVTTKTDIYAFGVVLLEILSGQPPIMMNGTKILLAETIGPLLEASNPTEKLKGWIDPSLHEVYSIEQAVALVKLAKSCVEQDPSLRPTMNEITQTLSRLVKSSSTKAEIPILNSDNI